MELADQTFVRWSGRFYNVEDQPVSTARMGYLLYQDGPDNFTLAESWTDYSGCYVFFPPFGNVDNDIVAAFVQAISKYLSVPGRENSRFAWFQNPSVPSEGLFARVIAVTPNPAGTSGTPATSQAARLDFRNFSLLVGAGCGVHLDADTAKVEFTNTADHTYLTVDADLQDGQLADPPGPFPAPAKRLTIVGPQLQIPLTGEAQGTVQFDMAMDNEVLDDLDAGLRYFVPGSQSLLFRTLASDPEYALVLDELLGIPPSSSSTGGPELLAEIGSLDQLKRVFSQHTIELTGPRIAARQPAEQPYRWWIDDGDSRYLVVNAGKALNVYVLPSAKVALFFIPATDSSYQTIVNNLNGGVVGTGLRSEFTANSNYALSIKAQVEIGEKSKNWTVVDGPRQFPIALVDEGGLAVGVKTREFPGQVNSQRYPVFDLDALIAVIASLDPLDPEDHDRTYLAFPPGQPLGSFFRTSLGHAIELTPLAETTSSSSSSSSAAAASTSPRLVMASRPAAITPQFDSNSGTTWQPDERAYYLIPKGDFCATRVSSDSSSSSKSTPLPDDCMLLCGASGIETINFVASEGLILRFEPGNAAFAAGFLRGLPPSAPALQASGGLAPVAMTSWISIHTAAELSSAAVYYWSQPQEAPLFQPPSEPDGSSSSAAPSSQPDVFEFLPVQTTQLGSTQSLAFPMTPLAGVRGDDLINYRDFEQKVVSAVRRKKMYDMAASNSARQLTVSGTPGAAPLQATTPQGLLATLTGAATKTWDTVTFAQSATQQLRFSNVGQPVTYEDQSVAELQLALQASTLFLVVTSAVNIQRYFDSDNTIEIAGWDFVLDPDPERKPSNWSTHNTVLIFKFFNKPLQELVQDEGLWAKHDYFVGDEDSVKTAQQVIQDNIDSAVDEYEKGDTNFEYFVDTVLNDKNWNGILALNVNVPLNGFPPEIEGLAAGVTDPSKFYAHHMGVNVSAVYKSQDGTLNMEESSLFGLINYVDSNPAQITADYGFVVLTLKILFHNSQIANFSSKVNLTINKLFSEPVSLKNPTSLPNVITLNGTYQSHGTQKSYVFQEQQENVFDVTSKVLLGVDVLKVNFSTVVPKAPDSSSSSADSLIADSSNSSVIQTRFSIWGKMAFRAFEEFDLFSFGSSSGPGDLAGKIDGLSFSNLGINMHFELDASSSAPTQNVFEFDPSIITFDLSSDASQARSESFYNHFPMKLTGLLSSGTKKSPSELGFSNVVTPLTNEELAETWYGLEFELQLGTLGDLAGKVGLHAYLLAAWSPNPNAASTMVGLKLPFAKGGTIGIEGVLALVTKEFQLVRYQVPGSGENEQDLGYLMKFNKVTLSLMKKTLPPGGTITVQLFGDPEGKDKSNLLGWYAAYAKKPPPKKKQQFGPPVG